MFLDIDKKPTGKAAMINDKDEILTYGQLVDFCTSYKLLIQERCLVFILCENTIGATSAFVASIENRVVPLMINCDIEQQLMNSLVATYKPAYVWLPERMEERFHGEVVGSFRGYLLIHLRNEAHEMYSELSLLLTTSGSTGSPKLVRHSYANLDATAQNVAAAFELKNDEMAMISLPINFTQGLSTVTSNLWIGGTILLSTGTLVQKEFWKMMKNYGATSFTGVPYSYDILDKMRFTRMELPALRIINQGGGRLTDEMFAKLSNYAKENGKHFVATYGSTETTSRMAYLKPEFAERKKGSIGNSIPGGKIKLLDEKGAEITSPKVVGEIVYYGANVTLGYSECIDDLKKGDQRCGVYHTGDLAYFDEDNCFFITGRKNRFLKLFGYRIGLDETERLLKSKYNSDFACVGTDKRMIIYTVTSGYTIEIGKFLQDKTGINSQAFEVRILESIPKNTAGKTQYKLLSNV